MKKNIKATMQSLNLQTATPPEQRQRPAPSSNPLNAAITASGASLRQKLTDLEKELAELRAEGKTGLVEKHIPIHAIDRPALLMRSGHYWKTERYREIKESIRHNKLREPITLRESPVEGRFILVKGDTRLHSHEDLFEETGDESWSSIAALVKPLNDEDAILEMVIENRDRAAVYAYDYAMFIRSVLEDTCMGNRESVMDMLDLSEGWLSKNLAVSRLPIALMDSFPSLYEASATVLYPLSTLVEKSPDLLPELMDKAELFKDPKPGPQAARLRAYLEQKQKKQSSSGTDRQAVTSDGKVMATVKQNRQFVNLKIDERAMPGFGTFVEKQLEDIYKQWVASQEQPDR